MTNDESQLIDVSVLIPVSEKRHDDLAEIYYQHKTVLEESGKSFEFIFVFDNQCCDEEAKLFQIIKENHAPIKIIKFHKCQGEAKALAAASASSRGKIILTLPAYLQIKPSEISKLFDKFHSDIDVLVANRYPRRDNFFNCLQAKMFHWLINRFTGESFHDISCGVKLIRREVMESINLYGDLHRFIPILAVNKGFNVREFPLQQAENDTHLRVYGPGVYISRLLDVFTIFFLTKFTQKPLRFFGLLGASISFIGLIISAVTIYQRIWSSQGLSERPLFLVGVIFLLVGLQTFFIGLVAEIIIFLHISPEPDYNIEEIIE